MLHYRLHTDPRSSHQQIAQIIRTKKPRQTLDVGAAQGFLGQLLQSSGLTLDAIEPNPHWATHAKPFYRHVFPTTIEQAHLPDSTYDAIVCADVLEHLPDPLAVLHQLRRLATPDALFVISLPNVAHLAVRLMLLFGHFPKMDRGILDRTHLQFFTRDTATNLLTSAGLRIQSISSTGIPLDELWPTSNGNPLFHFLARIQHLTLTLAPRLFAMQWIFQAEIAQEQMQLECHGLNT
jgi:2-polyprenyl-3-methyl-5-hydroxy-6-metoxy-1,4-benzoquinol methylase